MMSAKSASSFCPQSHTRALIVPGLRAIMAVISDVSSQGEQVFSDLPSFHTVIVSSNPTSYTPPSRHELGSSPSQREGIKHGVRRSSFPNDMTGLSRSQSWGSKSLGLKSQVASPIFINGLSPEEISSQSQSCCCCWSRCRSCCCCRCRVALDPPRTSSPACACALGLLGTPPS